MVTSFPHRCADNTKENPPHGHECVNSTVSAHAFSEDGFTWFMSPVSPYGTQVELTTGETVTVATRERPKLYFDANGQKTHLFNGVCGAPNCPNGPPTGCVDCKYASKWNVHAFKLDAASLILIRCLVHSDAHRACFARVCMIVFCWFIIHFRYVDWDYLLIQPLDV